MKNDAPNAAGLFRSVGERSQHPNFCTRSVSLFCADKRFPRRKLCQKIVFRLKFYSSICSFHFLPLSTPHVPLSHKFFFHISCHEFKLKENPRITLRANSKGKHGEHFKALDLKWELSISIHKKSKTGS